MQKVNNPHDIFFRKSFSVKEVALGFLKEFLDKEIIQELDLGCFFELQNDSFITNDLVEQYADLLYKTRFVRKKGLKGKEEYLYICLLFEHKSYPVKFPYRQFLSYITGAWNKMEEQNESLKLVLPIVVYHGEKKWHHKPMIDYFYLPNKHFRRFLPIFDYTLTDLSKVSEERILQLKDNAMLLNALMALKYARNAAYVEKHLGRILAYSDKYFSTELGMNYFRVLFVYINETIKLKSKKIYEIMTTLPKPIKDASLSTYQQIINDGIKQGIEQGIEQGAITAVRNMIEDKVPDMTIAKYLDVSQDFIDDVRSNLKKPKELDA